MSCGLSAVRPSTPLSRPRAGGLISSSGGSADTGAGVVGEFENLADDQVGRVVDEIVVKVEDLAGAVGVAQHVAGDGAKGIVLADLVDRAAPRKPSGVARGAGGGPGFGLVVGVVVVTVRPGDAAASGVWITVSSRDGFGGGQIEIGVGPARPAHRDARLAEPRLVLAVEIGSPRVGGRMTTPTIQPRLARLSCVLSEAPPGVSLHETAGGRGTRWVDVGWVEVFDRRGS